MKTYLMQYWRDYRIQKRESLTNAAAVQHSSESKPLPAFISHSAFDNKQSSAHDHISRQIDVQYCLHRHTNTVLSLRREYSQPLTIIQWGCYKRFDFDFACFNDYRQSQYSVVCCTFTFVFRKNYCRLKYVKTVYCWH